MKTKDTIIEKEGPDVPWLKDLAACTHELKSRGYQEDFRVDKNSLKTFHTDSREYTPADVKITNFYRFEGVSDPGDMTVLYVIETADGVKGTLADGYGPYASEEVSKFIVQVEEIQKQIPLADA
jgi:hypothetical protein